MTLWDRISGRMRDAIEPPQGPQRPRAAPSLAERLDLTRLSDASLAAELERRRRLRGKPAHRRSAADEELDALSAGNKSRMRQLTVSKSYSYLQLTPGATRAQIERAFRLQLRRDHPDRFISEPDKHQAAVALAVFLSDAYRLLLERS
ncbi:MAG: J domain-containing protein [Deltaproteobacteria bacterium]|nr:J domain-containing protein [Deltaproteobacteria bacterium]